MCGIVGFLDAKFGKDALASESLVRRMANAIAHRGPDGDGTFVDGECGIALGHRRLSIIDLSDAGKQPMTSSNGRWVISFNGEIYNYREIRKKLDDEFPGHCWASNSDTEVLIEAFSYYGFEKGLKLTNGMFAFAAWDRQERALYLARDRMGEKPLYFGWQESVFLFGSELKALAVHPAFTRRINPDALSLIVATGYVANPLSIYAGLSQLEPGRYLRIAADAVPGISLDTHAYWMLPMPSPRPMEESAAIDELDALLQDAVRLRMRADVPMGAFLSGGVDSSTIVGLMQAQSNTCVRSFSIGFHEDAYDESRFAAEVAKHIETDHTQMHVTAQDARDVIPTLPRLYDEPFADSSQIPTFLLSKLTRQHVTVSLSGDGGDELFAGYGRYFDFEDRWSKRNHAFDAFRKLAATRMRAMPPWMWGVTRAVAPSSIRQKLTKQKIMQRAAELGCRTQQELYAYLMQQWPPGMLKRPPPPRNPTFFDQYDIATFGDPLLGMTFLDEGSYLPDDILVKVDRASMAVSLESRVPLLDHRVVEFASRLPLDLKRRGSTGKWILRKVLDRYVPRTLVERPKQGFGIPVKEWLRGPLKAWGEDLVHDTGTIIGQMIDLPTVRQVWDEHQQGDVDHSYRLWVVLMLVAWAREWRPI